MKCDLLIHFYEMCVCLMYSLSELVNVCCYPIFYMCRLNMHLCNADIRQWIFDIYGILLSSRNIRLVETREATLESYKEAISIHLDIFLL